MFRSLRNRLIFSHILPALLVIPLMGVALVYMLESRLLLPLVYRDLSKEATLMAEITRNQPVFWQDQQIAQSFVNGVSTYLNNRLSIVTLDGRELASGESLDTGVTTQQVELPNLSGLGQGEVVLLKSGPLAEAFTPVYSLAGRPIGIIRMTTRLVSVSDEIYRLRYLLGGILVIGIAAGVALGSYLAFSLNQPIQRVTRSIQALADGDWQAGVEEQSIDEMRTLADSVNALAVQLNNLEKARRQLLANLVHELGRPLGAIRSAVLALMKGADKDPQLSSDLLSGIDSETARLQRLLDDLAGLQDQVLGKLELNRSPVQLNPWLAVTLSSWESVAREKGLLWEEDIPPELPALVMDPDRMAQAVGNLLSNAIKFTPVGGKVAIQAGLAEGHLVIQVADSGPGIPPDEQALVFQPFYRGSHGRRIVQGMGLGLSIAQDIVSAHGGEIRLESPPEGGSRFIVQLPRVSAP